MSSNPSVAVIHQITEQVSFYGPIMFIIIGSIGSICNLLTFTSAQLKNNSCSIYFLWAAVFDLITVSFGGISRLITDHLGAYPQNQSRVYCKIRAFIINDMPATATALIVAASIDRFMSTSEKAMYRSMANTKVATWMVPAIVTINAVLSIQYIVFFELQPACAALRGTYSLIVSVYSIVGTSILPHALMLGFGLGTYWHRRSARNRIQPFNVPLGPRQQRRKTSNEVQMIGVRTGSEFLFVNSSSHLFPV